MIFKRYPKINYTFQNDNTIEVVDIFRKVSFSQSTLNEYQLYDTYIISGGDKPEDVSRKIYGDSMYSPLIFMANQIINPNKDWPTEYTSFNTELSNIYSGTALYTFKMQNAQVNDIVVKTDSTGRNLDTTVWGRVESNYDKILRNTLISAVSGSFSANDYFIILRPSENGFSLVSDTPEGRIVRVESELILPYRFYDQNKNIVNPYRIINRSTNELTTLIADSDSEIITNLPYTNTTTLYNTVLFLYITSSAILRNAGITVETNRDFENKRNDKLSTIKIPKTQFINTIYRLYDEAITLDRVDRSVFIDVRV
jgi:hypothetical protein